MSKWIPAKGFDQDPPQNKEVLVYLKGNGTSALGHLFEADRALKWWVTGWSHSLPYEAVSHWMLKPNAPET